MTSLKDWNEKLPSLKTFAHLNIYVRRQYLDLEAVRGLTIQNLLTKYDASIKKTGGVIKYIKTGSSK